jgi:hypothetical protein
MKRTSCLIVGLILLATANALGADDLVPYPPAGDESARFRAEVVIEGLDNPCGLTLRPSSERDAPQEILFAESGAGRVLGFAADKPKEDREVITGLTVGEVEELETRASAWSLGFVTPTKLAVYGGMQERSNRVGVYVLPAEQVPLTADQQDHHVLIAENDAADSHPVLSGMTFGETIAFFSNGSAELPGQIYRSGLAANRIEMPQPLLNTAESQRSRWPTGVCLSPSSKMQFLVAAFAGELSEARDSRVVFLIPVSGKVSLDLTPGLIDIVGLAYSPSGQLYAIDLAWQEDDAGGVYRLDDARFQGQPACRAVKIAEVARPTSLLFAPDGAMYVTSWGKGNGAKNGTIVKITGEF